MENRHCIEIQWTVDGLRELAEETDAYLAKCIAALNCVEKFDWKILLQMEDSKLKVSLKPSALPIVRSQAIEWSACLVTSEGERWKCGKWEKKFIPPRDSSASWQRMTLASNEELLDHNTGLIFEGSARLSVRIRPTASDLNRSFTYFARSKVGVLREIIWEVEDFSSTGSRTDGDAQRYVLKKMSRDEDETGMEMWLFLGDEDDSVNIQVNPQIKGELDSFCVIMEEVSILRSHGSKEECWKREEKGFQDSEIAFIKKQKLMDDKENLLPGDVLTLCVKFRDFNNPSICYAGEMVEGVNPEFPILSHDPQGESTSSLSHDMDSFLDSGAQSDFTLHVGSEAFPVLRSVLCARSSVFRAMLESPVWLEATRKSMDVPDFGPDVVRLMVRYIYSDRVPQRMDAAVATELYAAADKYALLGLRAHCARLLVVDLRADTACVALRLAERHSDSDLKARVRAYMSAHQRAVFLSPEWAALMKDEPCLALEVEHDLHLKRFKST